MVERLRVSPSGKPFDGKAPGEVPIWTGSGWTTGPPPGGGFPPGTAEGQLIQWDGTAWLLVAAGATNGQVLTWNNTAKIWQPQTPSTSGQSAWDHIITDLASWEAAVGPPVSNVYTMPSGSFAIKAGFSLGHTDRIVIPSGAHVLLKSMGEKKLVGEAPGVALLTVKQGGTLQAEQLQIQNTKTTADSAAVRCEGTIQSHGCLFRCNNNGSTHGATIGGGIWTDFGSRFLGSVFGLRSDGATSPDAEIWLNGTRLSAGYTPGSRACVRIDGPTSTLSLQGSFWLDGTQNKPDGVRISANLHSLQINGGEASGLDDAVQYISGVVGRASIMNFSVAGSCDNGIDWPAANIPSPQGLTLAGNIYNTSGAAHQNFNESDPRVVVRGCLDSGGPMKETAIVP